MVPKFSFDVKSSTGQDHPSPEEQNLVMFDTSSRVFWVLKPNFVRFDSVFR